MHERPNASPLHPNPRKRIRPAVSVLGLQMKAGAPTPPVALTPRLAAMGPTPITPIPPEMPRGSAAQREGEVETGGNELDRAQAMERVMGGLAALFPPR